MNLIPDYKHYLEEQKLSPLSVKNYLADLNKFLLWQKEKNLSTINYQQLTINNWSSDFQAYCQFLKDQSTPASSLKRYTSSLRQLGQFLVNAGETAENPAAGITPMIGEVDKLLGGFEKYLRQEKLSASTVSNYMVDVRQFLNWFVIQQNES